MRILRLNRDYRYKCYIYHNLIEKLGSNSQYKFETSHMRPVSSDNYYYGPKLPDVDVEEGRE